MKKVFLIVIAIIFGTSNAFALTLKEALIQTYKIGTAQDISPQNWKCHHQAEAKISLRVIVQT